MTRDPASADALNDLAIALATTNRHEEALAALREAVRLRPAWFAARLNLATVLSDLGHLDEAEAIARSLVASGHRPAVSHNLLGLVLGRRGETAEALARFREALRLDPRLVDAHVNVGTALLRSGDLAAGFAEYDWRLLREEPRFRRDWPCPRWDGSDPAGKRLLLWAEGGLGDTLQFVRYATALAERGATVVVECQAQLLDLVRSVRGVGRVASVGEPLPRVDAHASVASLPHHLGTTLATVPAQVPYVFPDAPLVERWRHRLAAALPPGRLRVGINWQCQPLTPYGRSRSVPLAAFAPLATVPGVALVSLHRGPTPTPPSSVRDRFRIHEVLEGDDRSGRFDDVAAILPSLDLVVTVDTSTAHLAGAMARPTWVALTHLPCWRWLMQRDDSPWYPTLRLFRQPSAGDWEGVFAAMAEAWRRRVGTGG